MHAFDNPCLHNHQALETPGVIEQPSHVTDDIGATSIDGPCPYHPTHACGLPNCFPPPQGLQVKDMAYTCNQPHLTPGRGKPPLLTASQRNNAPGARSRPGRLLTQCAALPTADGLLSKLVSVWDGSCYTPWHQKCNPTPQSTPKSYTPTWQRRKQVAAVCTRAARAAQRLCLPCWSHCPVELGFSMLHGLSNAPCSSNPLPVEQTQTHARQ